MFIHRGFFVCMGYVFIFCPRRHESCLHFVSARKCKHLLSPKERRLRRRGFRKKKRSEPHFLLLQHSLPLKNSPLRFDDGVAFNFKSRLRRLDGMFAHWKTGEASWIWCHINQETTVRDIRKANSEALDSRIILAAEKTRFQLAENKHPKRTQNMGEVFCQAFLPKKLAAGGTHPPHNTM